MQRVELASLSTEAGPGPATMSVGAEGEVRAGAETEVEIEIEDEVEAEMMELMPRSRLSRLWSTLTSESDRNGKLGRFSCLCFAAWDCLR